MSTNIDVCIIGAQKAATTSLKNYLGEHPEVCTHLEEECTYFIENEKIEYDNLLNKYAFTNKPTNQQTNKIVIKSAAMYKDYQSLKRLKNTNPECLVIFLLREPVSRCYSAYQMAVRDGWMHYDFKHIRTCLSKPNHPKYGIMYRHFIEWSNYLQAVKELKKLFGGNVMFVLFEDFKQNPQETLEVIYDKIKIQKIFPNITKKHNQAFTPKYKTLSTLISISKYQPLKKFIKLIFPINMLILTKQFIERKNQKSIANYQVSFDKKTHKKLHDFFRQDYPAISKEIGLDVQKKWALSDYE
jgi:hypothetical protein